MRMPSPFTTRPTCPPLGLERRTISVARFKPWGNARAGRTDSLFLNRAVTAYEYALTVYNQTDMPADWAGTQNNLGNTLQALGERADGEDGLALLNRSVTAYKDALNVYNQANMPAAWATTQNNLGVTLVSLGLLSEDLGPVERGIEAIDQALPIYRTIVPDNTVSAVLFIHEQAFAFLESVRD